ncbi:MAG TPA: RecQ family ATP-dependent DNA helicase [Solirubrobacterales bacterium]|jgi:RecQ family ATP-dependent DNA helicase
MAAADLSSPGQSPADEERADDLLSRFGLEAFRPGQRAAVEAALQGRDSLIVMPTGGGKSLCYQLPGLASEDLTIVVSPLVALMRDQWKALRIAGHPVAMISSGMTWKAVRKALGRIRNGEARMVYCSPERFGSDLFTDALAERRIDLLTIDEAHCISEWGHDFRADYLRLPEIAEQLGRPTLMACTATATKAVAAEIADRFEMRDPLQVRSSFDRPNLSFDVVRLEGKGSKAVRLALLETGLGDPENRPAIVYCGTRNETDELAKDLGSAGLKVASYHAGMESKDRTAAQNRFMNGKVDVVVATNAFGMGVDKADVRSVWHATIPTSLEAYYQEAGRAGRDGLQAKAILLAMRADLGRLVRFNQERHDDPERVIARERGWRAYQTIKAFVSSNRCRRQQVLEHFGDRSASDPLGRCCDVCHPSDWPPDLETISVASRSRIRKKIAKHDLPPADISLLRALRSWRRQTADGIEVYKVVHSSALEGIASLCPNTLDGLEEISGIGPGFISKYGVEVIAIVKKHCTGVNERTR